MTKARKLADLGNVYDDGALSNRNLIINGAMTVSQRGTKTGINSAAKNFGGPDRFSLYSSTPSNSAAFSSIQQSVTDRSGFQKAFRVDCTTAASGALTTNQEIKLATELEANSIQSLEYGFTSPKKATLSFWVKSNKTGTGVVWFYRSDGGNRQNAKTYTINSANTWEYKTLTIEGDATNKIPVDNGSGLNISWILDSGPTYTSGTSPNGTWEALNDNNRYVGQTLDIGQSTDDYFDLTGVQFEIGDTATPFEHRSYGDELARCQRYYYRLGGNGRDSCPGSSNASQGYAEVTFPVQMRTTPSFSNGGGFTVNNFSAAGTPSDINLNVGSVNTVELSIIGGVSYTLGNAILLYEASTNSGNLKFDAEL